MNKENTDEFIKAIQSYQGISVILKEWSYQEILEQTSKFGSIEPSKLETLPMGGVF